MKQNEILEIPELIVKIKNRCASSKDIETVNLWRFESENNEELYKKLIHNIGLAEKIQQYNSIDDNECWQDVFKKINKISKQKPLFKLYPVLKYAAMFLLPLGVVLYLILSNVFDPKSDKERFADMQKQISSLQESSLVLADGEVVKLDANSPSRMEEKDGTRIVKKDSTLSYKKNTQIDYSKEVQFNSLVTPKSKVYTVVLSDGTKVWLNASSALRYPTFFNKGIRKVFLVGEAYFDVAKDKSHPFIVSTNGMVVKVHGTSFNVMAYPDERYVETTLVKGSVEVSTSEAHLMLKPGMQAQLNKTTKIVKHFSTDTKVFTSWKEGKYIFDYESLDNVMKKLSRWYDINIVYKDKDSRNLHFTGTLYKYENIEKTLHIIELATNIKMERRNDTLEIY